MAREFSACAECGMVVETNEFHPYAACLMYKSCRDAATVRDNLRGVRNSVVEYCAMVLDAADKNMSPADLSDRLRSLKTI